MKIVCVCGARPNFMKIAPIMHVLGQRKNVHACLVHTGQHYDEKMSKLFFHDLEIPEPDVNLEVGSASHAVQTARVMERFEPLCLSQKPDWIVVVGDVNSTIACALVASKLHIRIAHVEAGLRSFDRTMPEEVNRVLTDAISDLLFVTEQSGVENLRREGIEGSKVHLVGNVMIDTLLRHRAKADKSSILDNLNITPRDYAVVTLHRPSNVDDRDTLSGIVTAIESIAREMPVIFPVHPRSRANVDRMGLGDRVAGIKNLRLIDPVGYVDFLKLMSDARVVLTDSGGIQEETTILQVPCLTLRENTERPITISEGTNRLTGCAPESILAAYRTALTQGDGKRRMPALWDGKAAERIVDVLLSSPSGSNAHVRPEAREPRKATERTKKVTVATGSAR